MSYYYDDDDFDMFDQEDYDEYETVYQDYDHFIDAHFEEAWLSDHTDSQEYPAHRSIPRRSSDYTMRSSASPQKTTTIIKSPQTQALDLYKSDSEDSYDQEELAFYLDSMLYL
jgi:hypothetical protein